MNRESAHSILDLLGHSGMAQPRKVDLIQPGLYLGDLASAKDLAMLETKRITHVLTVCMCPELVYPASMNITHKCIEVEDSADENLLDHFLECARFIGNVQEGSGNILIHCEQGISRSPTVVAAYLMRSDRRHPNDAISTIKKRRPIIDPNPGFIEQLHVWGQCRGVLAGKMDYIAWQQKRLARSKFSI